MAVEKLKKEKNLFIRWKIFITETYSIMKLAGTPMTINRARIIILAFKKASWLSQNKIPHFLFSKAASIDSKASEKLKLKRIFALFSEKNRKLLFTARVVRRCRKWIDRVWPIRMQPFSHMGLKNLHLKSFRLMKEHDSFPCFLFNAHVGFFCLRIVD